METQNYDPRKQGIANSWPLTDFVKSHGKLSVAPFVEKTTGRAFKSLLCRNGNNVVFIAFGSSIGELSPAQLKLMKDNLYVHQMQQSGNYILGKAPGSGTFEGEEAIDL